MNYSSHKNLQKPLSTEKYNVAVFNTNADIIDSELHKLDLKNESQDNLLATKESVNDHTANKSNPHEVTKSQVGLSNVDNKSSAAIRSEITKENVTNALGYTPYTPYEVDNMFSVLETNIDWKETVETYDDILIEYPEPQEGWTVNVKDTDYTYRYNGTEWIAISANAIPKATDNVDGLLSKEDHATLINTRNSSVTHISDTIKHITDDERTLWNTVSDKVNKEAGKGLSSNDYTTTEKNKLNSIAANAEINQNAFSNIKVGNLTVSADSKTDTVELVAGDNITITPDVANDKIIIASTASLSSDGNVTPKDIGALPVTGGTITGRLKVLAKDTEADPRLDVQAKRVDILKTDGGNSVAKLTEEQIDFNVPIEAHDISAKSLEDSLVYRYIKPYKDQLYAGENNRNGNYTGMYVRPSASQGGIGTFDNGNFNTLLQGLSFTATTTKLRSKSAELELGDSNSKMAIRRNQNPVFEAEDSHTKIRIDKENEDEVGYVDIGQNQTTYANTVHRFLDENEKPGTIDVGQIQKNGEPVYFKENIIVERSGSIIITGNDAFPITIEIVACNELIVNDNDRRYVPKAVYSYVMASFSGIETAKLSANTSAMASTYGTITASTNGVTITAKSNNYLLVSVTGNATIKTL